MNYVSVELLRYAAMTIKAVEKHPESRLICGWQLDPCDPPCGNPAAYLVPDGTRVSAGGDIEEAPQWFCREHLESELGEPVREQPIFRRINNPGDPG